MCKRECRRFKNEKFCNLRNKSSITPYLVQDEKAIIKEKIQKDSTIYLRIDGEYAIRYSGRIVAESQQVFRHATTRTAKICPSSGTTPDPHLILPCKGEHCSMLPCETRAYIEDNSHVHSPNKK